jgi:hypothetical protein
MNVRNVRMTHIIYGETNVNVHDTKERKAFCNNFHYTNTIS